MSHSSYERARRTLDRALAAHRAQRRRPITNITVETSGIVHARLQSPSPEPPFRTQALHEWIWVDLESRRLAYRQSLEYPDFTFRERIYVDGEHGARMTPWTDGLLALPRGSLAPRRALYRRVPPLVLEEAREHAASLRWLGRREIDGRSYELISFAEDDGTLLTLYLDTESSLLARIERLYTDAVQGDAVETISFQDYREVERIPFPRRMEVRHAGVVVEELEPRLTGIDEGPPEDWPQELPAPLDQEDSAQPDTVVELGEDVYMLKGVAGPGYNALAVAFDDYVLVVETPLSSAASAAVVTRIREMFPLRPIRYAVPTHHHDDHAGGARAFVAAGATIVTTPGNRAFFSRMATAERTLDPDALSRNPVGLKIEAIEGGKRVFRDERHVVEIHDVGPNPHAEEHLIAYLPREKLVFQGDLVVFPEIGPIEPARPQGVIFARRLEELGLEVERIAGVHGRVGTMPELQRAVAAAAEDARRR